MIFGVIRPRLWQCTGAHQAEVFLHKSRSELWPNVSRTPFTAMGCQHCLPLSVVQLKGNHCEKPHWLHGVADTCRPGLFLVNNILPRSFLMTLFKLCVWLKKFARDSGQTQISTSPMCNAFCSCRNLLVTTWLILTAILLALRSLINEFVRLFSFWTIFQLASCFFMYSSFLI